MTKLIGSSCGAIEGCSSDGLHRPNMSAVPPALHDRATVPNGLPMTSIRIISSGSIDGRPIGEY
jgi:hypothetical protein